MTTKLMESYCALHGELAEAVEHLKRYVDTMPAPSDDDDGPQITWSLVGSLNVLRDRLRSATELVDEIGEES